MAGNENIATADAQPSTFSAACQFALAGKPWAIIWHHLATSKQKTRRFSSARFAFPNLFQ
jgi:hypothetical protein